MHIKKEVSFIRTSFKNSPSGHESADVQSWNSDTSVQKSSIMKNIYYEASKQEVDRTSRPKERASTVVVHFNINLNDGLRERLTNFE
ncbi:MAG: hypothetical protein EZS28_025444 [Streblomastix strix]|uniref:Uncharacterized protein n=1 Tax=Streblomastix strix TaxID=222440 RepID=A0A5J4V920_9EUKA|nr:MAG: hypothetical protein EZS28_025444 [Streblomastix strix]